MQLDETLAAEYARNDRYWKSIYHSYELFKSQYDSCVNRLLHARRHGVRSPETHRVVIESRHPALEREPSEEAKNEVKSRDGYWCLCCGETNKRLLQVDHIAPSYYGGSNALDNLQTLCRICNQTKGINTLNFRVHQTFLTTAPESFPVPQIPRNPRDTGHWEQVLRQAMNTFYQCAAVSSVRIGKRGQHFHEWTVTLYSGNPVSWLQPHLEALVETINESREEEGLQTIKGIRATAPDQAAVASWELASVTDWTRRK